MSLPQTLTQTLTLTLTLTHYTPPMLKYEEGTNTHFDPQLESCPLVSLLSGWTIRRHNGLAMPLGPMF